VFKDEGEKWLPIAGFEGWYEISNLGRVKRVNGDNSAVAGKILNPWNRKDYAGVSLYKDGIESSFNVHKIVTATFLGPCPEGKEVNHIDGDKANNKLSNLEYATHSENMLHAFSSGLLTRKGEKNSSSKLTESDVHEIRRLFVEGIKPSPIALVFGVHSSTICKILNRKSWSHLKENGAVDE